MRDERSGIEVDISFGVLAGKENSKVIIDYCNKFPLARPLTLIIKYFLKQKSLNNSWSGGIGSYTLIIMIISYLQVQRLILFFYLDISFYVYHRFLACSSSSFTPIRMKTSPWLTSCMVFSSSTVTSLITSRM
jgi:DNA polymerase sigma